MKICTRGFIAILGLLFTQNVVSQESIVVTGGNATYQERSVSYTLGQLFYDAISGSNGSLIQGIQQPYEISIITQIENSGEIILESIIFPNPSNDIIKLVVKTSDVTTLRFQLFDLNGILIHNNKIKDEVTEISMGALPSSIYLLRIVSFDGIVVKLFKVIKD